MSESTKTPLTVLLVGHCGPDAHMLSSAVGRAAPGARVETANDAKRLEALLPEASLLLVNRVLGSDLGGSGLDLIRSLKDRNGRAPAAMLVSNYEDAQREAEQAGARPGFGKASVMSEETRKRIRAALKLED